MAAWQWIFVLFGAFTIFLAILCYFLIVDFPDKNTFLTGKETAFVLQRIELDRGDSVADKLTKEKLLLHLSDWKGWACTLLYACTTTPAYAFAYFLPGMSSFPHHLEIRLTRNCSLVVLSGGGYNVQMSLLLSAPPYLSAAIYTFAVGPKFPLFRKWQFLTRSNLARLRFRSQREARNVPRNQLRRLSSRIIDYGAGRPTRSSTAW